MIPRPLLLPALALGLVLVPACISVPQVGSMWLDAGDHECATIRARTHAQALVWSTLTTTALAAWQSHLPAGDGSVDRVAFTTVRGLGTNAPEAMTTVLRIDRRSGDAITRTYAWVPGDTEDDGVPPEGSGTATPIGDATFVIDGIARRGTERAILVGSAQDAEGAHGIVVFDPGSPTLVWRAAHCRAPREEAPTASDAPVVAPTEHEDTPAPTRTPMPVEQPAPTSEEPPSTGPVRVPTQIQ
jgi:hypothetical protein